jgi:hypothetical protein
MGTQDEIQRRYDREYIEISVFSVSDEVSMCVCKLVCSMKRVKRLLLQAISFERVYIFDSQCIFFLPIVSVIIFLIIKNGDGKRLG